MQTTRKSAVDLTELAIGIVILGVVIGIGIVLLSKMAATNITSATTYQVANETVTATHAGAGLAYGWVKSVDVVLNASNNVVLAAGNYSLSTNTDYGWATLSNSSCLTVAGGGCSTGSWKVSYTVYNTSDPRYSVPYNGSVGLLEYSNWFKLLVIVGVAAVVISLVFMAFGSRRSEGIAAY